MLDLWLAFITGILSSLHCIGMCGPIVMGCVTSQKPVQISLSGGTTIESSKVGLFTPHLLYNSGRVISYSIVGVTAGFIGAGALISSGLQSGFSMVLGSIMILMALFQMNLLPQNLLWKQNKGFLNRMISDVVHSKAPEANCGSAAAPTRGARC